MQKQLAFITNIITLRLSEFAGIGLMQGKLGVALFYYELARHAEIKSYNSMADGLLDEVLYGIAEVKGKGMKVGMSGIGWGINYLITNKFVDANEDALVDMERVILEDGEIEASFPCLSLALYLLSKADRKYVLEKYERELSLLINTCRYYTLSIYDQKEMPISLVDSMLYFLTELKKDGFHVGEIDKILWRLSFRGSKMLNRKDSGGAIQEGTLWQQFLFGGQWRPLSSCEIVDMLQYCLRRGKDWQEVAISLGLYFIHVNSSEDER